MSEVPDIPRYTPDNAPAHLAGATAGTLDAMYAVALNVVAEVTPEWGEIESVISLPTTQSTDDPEADFLPPAIRMQMMGHLPASMCQRDRVGSLMKIPNPATVAFLKKLQNADTKNIKQGIGMAIAATYYPGIKKEMMKAKRAIHKTIGSYLNVVQGGFADEVAQKALATDKGLSEGLNRLRKDAYDEPVPTNPVRMMLAFEKDFQTATAIERWAYQQIMAMRLAPITADALSKGNNRVNVTQARAILLQTKKGLELEHEWEADKLVPPPRNR